MGGSFASRAGAPTYKTFVSKNGCEMQPNDHNLLLRFLSCCLRFLHFFGLAFFFFFLSSLAVAFSLSLLYVCVCRCICLLSLMCFGRIGHHKSIV